jgi:hypothetical protein
MSTHFLATPLGKKKINQEAHMADYKPKDGEITKSSDEDNIIRPITLDQLLEYLRKDVEAKNAANVAAALATCLFKTCSSKVDEQDKHLQVFTFDGTSTTSTKVPPFESEPPIGLFTSEQFKWMEEQLEAREAKIINRMNTIEHNASLKKLIESEIIIPSCSLPTPSASKPIDYPYGMPMNASKGQIGSLAFVGTNAMIAHPVYAAPITSVPQMANINDWIDDNMSELAGFKAPFTTIAYGPGIPPEGTTELNPIPPYIFTQCFNSWQNKENHERLVHDIDHTNVDSSARPNFQVGHADPQHAW